MILQEPPRTGFDLNFRVLGIPVRIHPMFWLIGLLFGMSGGVMGVLIWTVCLFMMILVHELGHAVTGIKYGSHSVRIVMGFGGLAIGATGRTRNERIAVIAAGPVVQFLFGIPFMAVFFKTEPGLATVSYYVPAVYPILAAYAKATGGFIVIQSEFLMGVFSCMSFFTVIWVALNLVPVYPLDGGQICAELLMSHDPVDGMAKAHKVSIVAAIIEAIVLYKLGFQFMILFSLYYAYMNYQMLQRGNGSYW